jgi:putative FmdB family regulatory protein
MPIYDYVCTDCGPFTEMMPMVAYEDDAQCPQCGADAARAMLSVPHLSGMNRSRFTAHAINEKNAHAPETSARTGRHPPGCGCCKTTPRTTSQPPKAMKSAGTRPWMISH